MIVKAIIDWDWRPKKGKRPYRYVRTSEKGYLWLYRYRVRGVIGELVDWQEYIWLPGESYEGESAVKLFI